MWAYPIVVDQIAKVAAFDQIIQLTEISDHLKKQNSMQLNKNETKEHIFLNFPLYVYFSSIFVVTVVFLGFLLFSLHFIFI